MLKTMKKNQMNALIQIIQCGKIILKKIRGYQYGDEI